MARTRQRTSGSRRYDDLIDIRSLLDRKQWDKRMIQKEVFLRKRKGRA